MRKQLYSLLILILSLSCTSENKVAPNSINVDIGNEIPISTAEKWISNYNKKVAIQGRESGYKITHEKLEQVLKNISDPVGVSFYHATESNGTSHVLLRAISLSSYGNIIIDANTNNIVDLTLADEWIKKYQKDHPNEVWYHFFGYNILSYMQSLNYNYFDIEKALNDEGKPQLLLMIWDDQSVSGRIMGYPLSVDGSSACPPCPR